MEVQIASQFNDNHNTHSTMRAPTAFQPMSKHFKSDLTFQCMVCSETFDDPSSRYEHMSNQHRDLYDNGFGADSDDDFNEDLLRLLEPICEIKLIDEKDDSDVFHNNNTNIVNYQPTNTPAKLMEGSEKVIVEQCPIQIGLHVQMQYSMQFPNISQPQFQPQSRSNQVEKMQITNGIQSQPPMMVPSSLEGRGRGRGRRGRRQCATIEAPSAELPIFKCTVCHESFSDVGDLGKHFRSHTDKTPFQCSICQKSFTHVGSLITHLRIHKGERPYKCLKCPLAFPQSSSLMVHMRSHATPKPHQCDQCEKGFVNSSSLLIHKKTHTELIDRFSCEKCQMQFKTATLLAEHELTHTYTHLYQCSICQEKFDLPKKLVQHMKSHTGEKPFRCTLCSKTFTQPGALKVHTRTHLGEEREHCSAKTLTQVTNNATAGRNMKRINTENSKSFNCLNCMKSYSNKWYLKRHKCHRKGTAKALVAVPPATLASEVVVYTCKLCNEQFSDSAQLIQHVSLKHSSILSIESSPKVAPCIICHKEFCNAPELLLHLREHVANGDQQNEQKSSSFSSTDF